MNKKRKISHSKTMHKYFLAGTVLPVIITAGLMFVSPVFLVTFIPLHRAFSDIAEKILSRNPSVPKADIVEIPDDSPVLVVITALLTGEKNDSSVFDKLESIYHSCGGRNIYFGVLADIRDSKTAKAPGDGEILDYARGRTDSLCSKHGKHFILFERRRMYSKSEEAFICRDRKRGAVYELVSFLKGEKTTFADRTEVLAKSILDGISIKYIVILDSDITPELSSVTDMCCAMLHPLAKPVIDSEKGIVTKGYGIMQPIYIPEFPGENSTLFSRIMYENPTQLLPSDTFISLNGETTYTGNGIIDVDAFYTVIVKNSIFPEDSILSHGILESAKLRCAVIPDLKFTYIPAKSQTEYTAELHRRIRGDIQNLIFLLRTIMRSKIFNKKNSMSFFSELRIIDRAISAVTPIFSVSGIFCAMISKGTVSVLLTLLSLLYIIVRFLFSLKTESDKKTFSQNAGTTIHSFTAMFFMLSMLPALALSSLDAVSKTLYRSFISHKKLLHTESHRTEEQYTDGLCEFVHRYMVCTFAGFLLLVFSQSVLLKIIALLWFAFPVISYRFSAKQTPLKEVPSVKQCETAKKYASDLWRYIAQTVTPENNHLPVYTAIRSPSGEKNIVASPTSIGFYLLSVLCARDFGFITTEEAEKRISDTITTAEKLGKYRGHLYNSYDIQSLSVLPTAFVSTAENGNFTACLTALRRGLLEYVSESTSLVELIKRITALEECRDFACFYNFEKNTLSKGIYISCGKAEQLTDTCPTEESVPVSYIMCAKRQLPKKYLSELTKNFTEKSGNLISGIFLPVQNDYSTQSNTEISQDIGIRLCCLCDFCCGNILRKRFMSDSRMNCAKELLHTEHKADNTCKLTKYGFIF